MDTGQQQSSLCRRVLEELGLVSVYNSSTDVKLLCMQRFVRLFAYGASTLILVSYLEALGNTKTRIGLFMTLTLAGDVCISFFLTLFADAIGRKAILALGAVLMAASGIIFVVSGNYWVLLIAAICGVISPSGNEIGPFRAIEESIVAQLTAPENRSDIYAWYNLLGPAGTAFGMITGGWVLDYLIERLRWDYVSSYRVLYMVYAAIGVIKLMLTLLLSHFVESGKKQEQTRLRNGNPETAPLLNDETTPGTPTGSPHKKGLRALLPEISKESVSVVFNLSLLFALDAFASGLVPLSWMTFFFKTQYGLEEGKLGTVFFITSLVAAASMLVASALAKRIGNIQTMVFTHLPSSMFLALIPLRHQVQWSLVFLILRACTHSMDTAPRSAFLATIVLPEERTAVMGTINVVKTTAQSLGPVITGVLADKDHLWVSFVCAGILKACYDLGLLAVFKNKERERELAEQRRIEEEHEHEHEHRCA
ncbi:major facilitator superfamily domain-containing protein [Pseudomassariella vexata]|uniref:Major facilitator superfamily domain-containing protein n=1 Tax=Pseudomassariella vexata TaxID=1141098 RepID=A0A1Y2DTI0_9PEZI|nr:major facilitator superfamily domain-containing protein [Pseudomassariella vexata]ORY62578.1 major facilitator superfamily domain-containing protein [Pseudomassariella vexata]